VGQGESTDPGILMAVLRPSVQLLYSEEKNFHQISVVGCEWEYLNLVFSSQMHKPHA